VTDIETKADCGNSPKNALLQALVVAVARADSSAIAKLVAEDVCWTPVGRKPVMGREQFCKQITRHGPATRVTIEHVISHGRAGAADGIVAFGKKRRAFCYVFEFSNAKGTEVKAITAYSLPLA
jgi:hypothetical protein